MMNINALYEAIEAKEELRRFTWYGPISKYLVASKDVDAGLFDTVVSIIPQKLLNGFVAAADEAQSAITRLIEEIDPHHEEMSSLINTSTKVEDCRFCPDCDTHKMVPLPPDCETAATVLQACADIMPAPVIDGLVQDQHLWCTVVYGSRPKNMETPSEARANDGVEPEPNSPDHDMAFDEEESVSSDSQQFASIDLCAAAAPQLFAADPATMLSAPNQQELAAPFSVWDYEEFLAWKQQNSPTTTAITQQEKVPPASLKKKHGALLVLDDLDDSDSEIDKKPKKKKGRKTGTKGWCLDESRKVIELCLKHLPTDSSELAWKPISDELKERHGCNRAWKPVCMQFDRMERGEVQAKIGTEEERRSLHEQARKAGQIQRKQCNPEVGGSEIGGKNASSSGRLKKLPKADTRTPKCNNHDEIMKSISNQLKEIEERHTTRNNSNSHANEAVTLLSHEVADLKEGQKSMATKLESILELLRKQNA